MEGVVDYTMRDLLTQVGGIDYCVTEFLRVSDRVLPAKVFRRLCPELDTGGKTASGTPVILQLLGNDPSVLAGNARKGAKLGAPGIDLNFGCPARTVNKSKGGAVLLDTPELIYKIVKAVRQAVPEGVPVSAKMRLGNKDKTLAVENAQAIATAGANSLAVHARTKLEGYRPPAHWEWIARIRETVAIPVVANGEVWSWRDYQHCRAVSGCENVMIGRGLIAKPDLANVIKYQQVNRPYSDFSWSHVLELIEVYLERIEQDIAAKYVHGRIKQWLHHLRREYSEAELLFQEIKKLKEPQALRLALKPRADRVDNRKAAENEHL